MPKLECKFKDGDKVRFINDKANTGVIHSSWHAPERAGFDINIQLDFNGRLGRCKDTDLELITDIPEKIEPPKNWGF